MFGDGREPFLKITAARLGNNGGGALVHIAHVLGLRAAPLPLSAVEATIRAKANDALGRAATLGIMDIDDFARYIVKLPRKSRAAREGALVLGRAIMCNRRVVALCRVTSTRFHIRASLGY